MSLTPPGNSLVIAQNVPQSWIVRIRGGGHGVMYQYPDEFSGIVLSFLSLWNLIIRKFSGYFF